MTDNGVHEIYVNAAVDDGSDIAQMMQYFKKSVGTNPKFPQISKQVEYYKSKQEGVADMCDIVEEYAAKRVAEATRELEKVKRELEKRVEDAARERANTTARENAFSLLKNGGSLDIIKKSIPSLTEEDLKELEALANAANS